MVAVVVMFVMVITGTHAIRFCTSFDLAEVILGACVSICSHAGICEINHVKGNKLSKVVKKYYPP